MGGAKTKKRSRAIFSKQLKHLIACPLLVFLALLLYFWHWESICSHWHIQWHKNLSIRFRYDLNIEKCLKIGICLMTGIVTLPLVYLSSLICFYFESLEMVEINDCCIFNVLESLSLMHYSISGSWNHCELRSKTLSL